MLTSHIIWGLLIELLVPGTWWLRTDVTRFTLYETIESKPY